MKMSVWVTTHQPGFHWWPGAPPHRDYLATRHRHLFHIRAEVAVTEVDRQIEFHDLQELIATWWPGPELGSASCESLAGELADYLTGADLTVIRIDVSEDGECGAAITYQQ